METITGPRAWYRKQDPALMEQVDKVVAHWLTGHLPHIKSAAQLLRVLQQQDALKQVSPDRFREYVRIVEEKLDYGS